MKTGTFLEIDLDKVRDNSRLIVEKCRPLGIEVLGVTKGFSAKPRIVKAMIQGGISTLADSRLENILALRKKGFTQDITLLRIPRISAVKKVIAYTDYSVNSEYSVIRRLSDAALAEGKKHKIVLMVDVGDLREGVLPEDAFVMAQRISMLKGVTLAGVGTNMGCYGGILPTMSNLNMLIDIADEIEKRSGIKLEIVSGGGTSSLRLIEENEMPKGINQLRIGEGILLGTDTTHDNIIPWLHQDAFVLRAEVIEVKTKPSVPIGELGHDAFGNTPVFEDNGMRKRAIVSLGRQDVNVEGVFPLNTKMHVLGASSDHLIVDVTDADENIKVGGQISFKLNYQGLLFLSNSKYVKKVYIKGGL
ncbi:MAG: alanine/ornithine racemase family PLP-dependent enzyme [Eubacteriales bacterium]